MIKIFPKGFIKEGAGLLLLGVLTGMAVKNIALIFSLGSSLGELPTLTGVSNIALGKFMLFQAFGASPTLSIFLTNLTSLIVIIGYPYLGIEFNVGRREIYTDLFPKVVVFSIGFLSIGLLFPTFTQTVAFLLFLIYLIPHGITEVLAILLAYSTPREWKEGISIPWKRLAIAVLLLVVSAFVEARYSLSIASSLVADIFI